MDVGELLSFKPVPTPKRPTEDDSDYSDDEGSRASKTRRTKKVKGEPHMVASSTSLPNEPSITDKEREDILRFVETEATQTPSDGFFSFNVYKKAHHILSQGSSKDSKRELVFLLGLLRAPGRARADEARAHAARAREHLRSSGCLQVMLNMFLNSETMDAEPKKMICECLVEACTDCQENQDYCSHLIPVCIQRCDLKNIEILKLIHCLLLNNTSNINIFVEFNGTSIFTKESIQDNSSMELLSIVVQNSSAAYMLKRDSDLLNCLLTIVEDYKVNCRGSSKMVEWATLILFHIASHIEGDGNSTQNTTDIETEETNSGTSLHDLTASLLLEPNWNKLQSGGSEKLTTTVNDDRMSFSSNMTDLAGIHFEPRFVSTPKRIPSHDKKNSELSKVLKDSTNTSNNVQRKGDEKKPDPITKNKLSTSARLLNIVNNSCASIYSMMGSIFYRNSGNTKPQKGLLKSDTNNNNEKKPTCRLPVCSRQKHLQTGAKGSQTLKRKLRIRQKHRKSILNKIKTGMHLYGCNFKKIAKAMWSQEKEMTPHALYSIYRKCIVSQINLHE